MLQNFLSLLDFDLDALRNILALSHEFRKSRDLHNNILLGKTIALIFEKPSTRTRVSFEVAIRELGGSSLVLQANEIQISRGESVADTARVLSRYVDGVMLRTSSHDRLLEFSRYATIPVINGLSNLLHPCQILADLAVMEENFGLLEGKTVAFLGDGSSNVAHSLILGASMIGMNVHVGCHPDCSPQKEIIELSKKHSGNVEIFFNKENAIENAEIIYTDVWTSMGQEGSKASQIKKLSHFQVTKKDLISEGKPQKIFLHCLPAHKGEEVTEEAFESPVSKVFDQAEFRLHAQKALLVNLFMNRA